MYLLVVVLYVFRQFFISCYIYFFSYLVRSLVLSLCIYGIRPFFLYLFIL